MDWYHSPNWEHYLQLGLENGVHGSLEYLLGFFPFFYLQGSGDISSFWNSIKSHVPGRRIEDFSINFDPMNFSLYQLERAAYFLCRISLGAGILLFITAFYFFKSVKRKSIPVPQVLLTALMLAIPLGYWFSDWLSSSVIDDILFHYSQRDFTRVCVGCPGLAMRLIDTGYLSTETMRESYSIHISTSSLLTFFATGSSFVFIWVYLNSLKKLK